VACSSRRQVSGDGRPPAGVLGEAESPGIPRDLGFRAGDSPARCPGHGAVSPGAARRREQARTGAGTLTPPGRAPRRRWRDPPRDEDAVGGAAAGRPAVQCGQWSDRLTRPHREAPARSRLPARPAVHEPAGSATTTSATRRPSAEGTPADAISIAGRAPGADPLAVAWLVPLRCHGADPAPPTARHSPPVRAARRAGAPDRRIGPARAPRPAPGHGDTSSARTTRENNRPT
jgi:hypothetical protein